MLKPYFYVFATKVSTKVSLTPLTMEEVKISFHINTSASSQEGVYKTISATNVSILRGVFVEVSGH